MLISTKSCAELQKRLDKGRGDIFCRGLFLSARWIVLSGVVRKGVHFIILPNIEAAEYCTSDLYNFVDGDRVFFLPESGRNVERSNYKSSLAVQRTAAISSIISGGDDLKLIVSYPEAIAEKVPSVKEISDSIMSIRKGDEISHEKIVAALSAGGFERVDFVSAPGQYAIRGSLVDIFSYSNNYPYRISFWGDEVEKINSFDCNTQLSTG